jgi:anti-sigma regulatory factor (Ser/Thr protein kinase)
MAPLPSSVRAARTVIRRSLDALDPERAERAAACGSELVANAVRHGRPPIVLSVVHGVEDVVIAVADGSREPPRPRSAPDDDPTGRGTLIIDRLADRWGVEFLPGGKLVWCRVGLGAIPPAPHAVPSGRPLNPWRRRRRPPSGPGRPSRPARC